MDACEDHRIINDLEKKHYYDKPPQNANIP